MRSWSRTLTVLGAALPMLLSVVMGSPTSGASTPTAAEEWTQAQIDARYSAYRQRINQLLAEGKTQPEISSVIAQDFGIISLPPITVGGTPPTKEAEDEASQASSSASSASSITMYTPTFSYDTMLHKYVMAASWEWKTCADNFNQACWTKDKSSAGNVGGPDGMAIKINRPISRDRGGISTSDNCGTPKIDNNQADTDNGYGLGFIEQDEVAYSSANGMCAGTPYRYNWHRGTVSESFDFDPNYPSCTNYQIQVDAKIGHTWSSTSVDYIGLSTNGIVYGWSHNSHRWNAIPATPVYGFC